MPIKYIWNAVGVLKDAILIFLISCFLSLAVACLSQAAHYEPNHWMVIEVNSDFLDCAADVLLVDARLPHLYVKGHIPGAILFSEELWDDNLPIFLGHWSPEKLVIIYCDGVKCDSGRRLALRILTHLPDVRVCILAGGYQGWVK